MEVRGRTIKKLTIVVPLYNKEDYIARTLESILNQSQDIDIIIIDDGSTDSSLEIVRKMVMNDSRFRIISNDNRGVSYTRNLGIKLANTEYIMFLDADDTLNKDALKEILDDLSENEVFCFADSSLFGLTRRVELIDYLKSKIKADMNNWIFKREYLINNNIEFNPKLSFGEDRLFITNTLTNSNKIKILNKKIANYECNVLNSLSQHNIQNIEKDMTWINCAKNDILRSSISKNKKQKTIRILDEYITSCAILNRILMENDRKIKKETFYRYKRHIKILSLVNGLKSINLMLKYIKIKYSIR